MSKIKQFVSEFRNELINYRNKFHTIPEPSYKEFKTSEFVQNELKKLNVPYKVVGKTAIVAEIGSGYPVVGVRFNMDGLEGCIEYTGLKHSAHGNCAHACGHDVELAWAIGIARYFSTHKHHGTVRLVFQPAEEGPGDDSQGRDGGKFLAEEGVFDGLDALFSLHVDPDMEIGEICIHNGTATVDALDFEFRLTGLSSHLSRPDEGVNVKSIVAKIILDIDSLREEIKQQGVLIGRNPFLLLDISQVSMGLDLQHPLQAEINTLPNAAVLKGSSRIYGATETSNLKNSLITGLQKIASESDTVLKKENSTCGCELHTNMVAIATVNNPQVVAYAVKAINQSGFKHIDKTKYWKDAAGWTSEKAPVCHGFVGCGKASNNIHTSTFYPNEEVLPIGLEVLLRSVQGVLAKNRKNIINND